MGEWLQIKQGGWYQLANQVETWCEQAQKTFKEVLHPEGNVD